MRERSQATTGVWTDVHAYFARTHDALARSAAVEVERMPAPRSPWAVARDLFGLLTSRPFTYLTRIRCEPYRTRVEACVRRSIEDGRPLTLYYDIGGGYRASLRPGTLPLSFEPGLGELLLLRQVRTFREQAQSLCPLPIRFRLVVDNLCAHHVNGIPLSSTRAYCGAMRELIDHFRLEQVELLVESEQCSHGEYGQAFEHALAQVPTPAAITPAAHANAERFVGRRLSTAEALAQVARYAAGGSATESCLARVIDGIRLTQRATPATLAFRSFPGADVRIQCGEVALAVGARQRVRPLLLSSTNQKQYREQRIDVADWGIPRIAGIRLVY